MKKYIKLCQKKIYFFNPIFLYSKKKKSYLCYFILTQYYKNSVFYIQKDEFYTAISNLGIIVNEKEKEILSIFLDPGNQNLFNIEPFMKKVSSSKKKSISLPEDLVVFLDDFSKFLEKRSF